MASVKEQYPAVSLPSHAALLKSAEDSRLDADCLQNALEYLRSGIERLSQELVGIQERLKPTLRAPGLQLEAHPLDTPERNSPLTSEIMAQSEKVTSLCNFVIDLNGRMDL